MNENVWISTETSLEKAYSRLKRFDADFDELRGYLSGYALSRSTRQGGDFMQSRKYYEAYWSQYDDVVTLNEFRKMLGGLGEVQARRLLQNKTVKSFKIRGEYHIPKQCVIDYVLSAHYAKYRQILKAQIP